MEEKKTHLRLRVDKSGTEYGQMSLNNGMLNDRTALIDNGHAIAE
jgi:hypothetical protein